MTFDPLAASATLAIVLLALATRAAYHRVQAQLVAMRRDAYQEGYDACEALLQQPIEEATWRTDN